MNARALLSLVLVLAVAALSSARVAAQHRMPSGASAKTLEPGSYFGSEEGAPVHRVSSSAEEETVIYVRTEGGSDIVPVQPGN